MKNDASNKNNNFLKEIQQTSGRKPEELFIYREFCDFWGIFKELFYCTANHAKQQAIIMQIRIKMNTGIEKEVFRGFS